MPVSTPHWITFVSACAHSGSFNLPSRTMGAPAVERAHMASWRGGCAHAVAASMHAAEQATASVVTRFMVRTSLDAVSDAVGCFRRGGRGPYTAAIATDATDQVRTGLARCWGWSRPAFDVNDYIRDNTESMNGWPN